MKVYLAETGTNGKGIFAIENIPEGSLIFLIEGEILRRRYDLLYFIGERWVGVGKETWIEPLPSNPIYFTNHSCEPNAALEDRIDAPQP